MKKYLNKILYHLGGTDYVVIKHCSYINQTQYKNLGISLIISSLLGFFGGFEICHQFTNNYFYCIAVGLLWGGVIFSFDYFSISSSTSKVGFFTKIIRIIVGISNVFITVSSLLITLNSSLINNNLNLKKPLMVQEETNIYDIKHDKRYERLNKLKNDRDKADQKCQSLLAQNYFKLAAKVHQNNCLRMDSLISKEKAIVDTSEVLFYYAYLDKVKALRSETSEDFFTKANELPTILTKNWYTLLLAICFFIFLSYIELQCIMLKINIDQNDEYHTLTNHYNMKRKADIQTRINEQLEEKNKDVVLRNSIDNFKKIINQNEEIVLLEMEYRNKFNILCDYGYKDSANLLKNNWQNYLNSISILMMNKDSNINFTIFELTQPMMNVIQEIKSKSSKNINENIFEWILTNVQYDSDHNGKHYRTARECFNEKRGLCGELTVLYISFLRYLEIEANFVEVLKDNLGFEVNHACAFVNGHLSDIAYKQFKIEHNEYKILSDEELLLKYKNWNK